MIVRSMRSSPACVLYGFRVTLPITMMASPFLHLSSFVWSASENAITVTHSVSFSRISAATSGDAMLTPMLPVAKLLESCSIFLGSAARLPR